MNVVQRTKYSLFLSIYGTFGVFWLVIVATNERPEFSVMYFWQAMVVLIVATVWAMSANILFGKWNRKAASVCLNGDLASQFLAVVVGMFGTGRREWGHAMAAELCVIEGTSERWTFVLGCSWASVVLFLRDWSSPLIPLLAAIAAMVTHQVGDRAFPVMQSFATIFAGFSSLLAAHSLLQKNGPNALRTTPTTFIVGMLALASCIAATSDFIAKNPDARGYFTPLSAAFLAGTFSVCVWYIAFPPNGLTTGRVGRYAGIIAAASLAGGFVATARLSVHSESGPLLWNLFAPELILFAVSAFAASRVQSFRSGIQSAFWGCLLGALLVYVASLTEAMYRFSIDGRALSDGELGLPIGVNLPDAIWSLVQIPLVGFPFGVFGAAFGEWHSRSRGWAAKDLAMRGDIGRYEVHFVQWPLGGR